MVNSKRPYKKEQWWTLLRFSESWPGTKLEKGGLTKILGYNHTVSTEYSTSKTDERRGRLGGQRGWPSSNGSGAFLEVQATEESVHVWAEKRKKACNVEWG